MITVLYDLDQLLVQGEALLRDNGSMVIWSKTDAAVSVLFALIHDGRRDWIDVLEAACKVPQVDKSIAQRMLLKLCGHDPQRHLWRHHCVDGLSLWPRG